MRKIGNRLLITLVLFGVLSAAAAHAQSSPIRLGKAPADPIGGVAFQPQATPNAGEPDVGSTSPQKTSIAPMLRTDPKLANSALQRRDALFAAQIRWALVMWMAQYLNLSL